MEGLDSMPAYAVYNLSKSTENSEQAISGDSKERINISSSACQNLEKETSKEGLCAESSDQNSGEGECSIAKKRDNDYFEANRGDKDYSDSNRGDDDCCKGNREGGDCSKNNGGNHDCSGSNGGDSEGLNFGTAGVFVSTRKKQKLSCALREAIKNKKKYKKRMSKGPSAKRLKGNHRKNENCKEYKSLESQVEECVVEKNAETRQSEREEQEEVENMVEDDSVVDELEYEPFKDLFDQNSYRDSRRAARDLFSMLIKPLDVDLFFSESWEKRPVLLRRHQHQYNKGWFSTQELDSILRDNYLEFTKNVDVTTYEDGVRKTHNLDGRATAPSVWDFYKNGCSVRILNPQTYSKGVWLLTSTLQELFGSCMGANVYLTPPGSQGFAPHYDDIEAFVMQLEGKKLWKIYKERSEKDKLPRVSSPNFTEKDLGELALEAVLEPGDLLYFPRGTIHQASTLGEQHSLHITLSTFQKNSWADLMEKLIPAALEVAIKEDEEFRYGLPVDYLQYMGVMFSDSSDSRRAKFLEKVSALFAKLSDHIPIDAAVDQLGSDFMHGCLPPYPTSAEMSQTSCVTGDRWEQGRLVNGVELKSCTKVKLIRYGAARLVVENEGEGVALFTTATNSRLNGAKEDCGIYISNNEASGIEYLIQSYPDYVAIESIPLKGVSVMDKIDFSYTLFLQGVLMAETGS